MRDLSPTQASAVLAQGACLFVDVRTVEEFATAHPQGALNVPVAEPNAYGQMQLNPKFMAVMAKIAPRKEQTIVLSCHSGGRSAHAGEMLESAGYTDVINVDGGFAGRPGIIGWAKSGLPTSRDVGDDNSYASLLTQAGQA